MLNISNWNQLLFLEKHLNRTPSDIELKRNFEEKAKKFQSKIESQELRLIGQTKFIKVKRTSKVFRKFWENSAGSPRESEGKR